jgi:hypothetical protein
MTKTLPKECINWNAVECKESGWGSEGENNTMIHLRNGAEVRHNTPTFSDV